MPSEINITRPNRVSLEAILERGIRQTGTTCVGLAVAYVSVYGANFLKTLSRSRRLSQVRLITDTRDAITHPQALRTALDEQWLVRTVHRSEGTFHPKMYVAGEGFAENGSIVRPRMFVVGSNNLTNGGLNANIESNLFRTSNDPIQGAGEAFRILWSLGRDLNEISLEKYEQYFAERNRYRPARDFQVLGVADEPLERLQPSHIMKRAAPSSSRRAITTRVATTAWTGLESSTGEYRYQSRSAGEVLARIIGLLWIA